MNLQMSNPRLLLHPGQSVVLDDAKGVTICPHEAKVWVTPVSYTHLTLPTKRIV